MMFYHLRTMGWRWVWTEYTWPLRWIISEWSRTAWDLVVHRAENLWARLVRVLRPVTRLRALVYWVRGRR